jgi:hypothetical protein
VAGSGFDDKPQAMEGTDTAEGGTLDTTLADSTPMVLQDVDDSYESMAFGVPMLVERKCGPDGAGPGPPTGTRAR